MDGAVLAFDYVEHKELWRYEDAERAQEYRNSAALSDKLVIVSSQYKQVDAISIETGERKWRHTLRRRADASPVIAGEDVWIAATDGRLIRLGLEDGTEEKWSYEIRGAFLAAPAIAGNELFIADDEGVLRCFGAKP
jgi:outer membrane protein assembly factor BamB